MKHARVLVVPTAVWLLGCSSSGAAGTGTQPTGAAPPSTDVGANRPVMPVAGTVMGATAGTPMAAGAIAGTRAVGPVAGQVAVPAAAGTGSVAPASTSTGLGTPTAGNAAGVGAPSAVAGGGANGAGAAPAGAGAGGVTGSVSGGAAGSAGAAPTGAVAKRSCVKSGSEVVSIGDSYSNYAAAHMPIATLMTQRAVKDGALGASDRYLDYAMLGTTLAAAPAAIPEQWNTAKTKLPIKVVIVSAGGNDSLISNPQCQREDSDQDPVCQQVVANSLAAGKALWKSMKESGVGDVLWFWYPHLNGPGILNSQGTGAKLSDYAFKMLDDAAKAASDETFHAWMVSTVDIFKDHPEYFYVGDNLHPNDVGEGKIADRLWELMKMNCIGQASASGCCMP